MEVTVRVVSSPLNLPDVAAHLAADDAQALKATATAMFRHALGLAAREAQLRNTAATGGEPASPEVATRTHRYLMGSHSRAERGQKVGESCGRVMLRTLRGWVLSAPVRTEPPTLCEQPYPL